MGCRVMILGAGASSAHGAAGETRPPMARNFMVDPYAAGRLALHEPLARYLRAEANVGLPDGPADIESVYRAVEAAWRLGIYEPLTILERFGAEYLWVNPVDQLASFIVDVVWSSTRWLTTRTCPVHDAVVSRWLRPGDVVISFNYDLIMDASLALSGEWNEKDGYGFESDSTLLYPTQPAYLLLKPHGSLNWFRSEGYAIPLPGLSERGDERVPTIRILPIANSAAGASRAREAPEALELFAPRLIQGWMEAFTAERVVKAIRNHEYPVFGMLKHAQEQSLSADGYLPLLVVPTPAKPLDEMRYPQLALVWKRVWEAVAAADEIAVCGFSFADWHFNQVMREALRGRPTRVTMISRNPDDLNTLRKEVSPSVSERFDGWLAEWTATLA